MSTDPQNTKVQRYHCFSGVSMWGHIQGTYVLFTDYAALEVKHAALLAGIDEVMSSAACLTGYSIGDAVAELQRVLREHAMTPDNFPTEKKGGDDTDAPTSGAGATTADMSGIPSDPASRSTEPSTEDMQIIRLGEKLSHEKKGGAA